MELIVQSTALYGSWTYIPSHHILIDAGDGVAQALGRRVSGINMVLITHAHVDHVSGLYALVRARMRNPELPPLMVFVPSPLPTRILALMEFMKHDRTDQHVLFTELGADVDVPFHLGQRQCLARPFLVNHGKARAFGYTLFEERTRLNPAFLGRPTEDIVRARQNGEAVNVTYEHAILTHTGDTLPMDPALLSSPDLLIHDVTFLRDEDRDEADADHSTLTEALQVFQASGARHMLGIHMSSRYAGGVVAAMPHNVHLLPPHTVRRFRLRPAGLETILNGE